jgi:hypothetical protein
MSNVRTLGQSGENMAIDHKLVADTLVKLQKELDEIEDQIRALLLPQSGRPHNDQEKKNQKSTSAVVGGTNPSE